MGGCLSIYSTFHLPNNHVGEPLGPQQDLWMHDTMDCGTDRTKYLQAALTFLAIKLGSH